MQRFGPIALSLAAAVAAPTLGPAPTPSALAFPDVTAASGITFVHNNGRAGQKYLPETVGTGGAFVDLNNAGPLAPLLDNRRDWKPGGRKTPPALYKNNGNGTFTNVVAGSGFDVSLYGMGGAAGDYENGGPADL